MRGILHSTRNYVPAVRTNTHFIVHLLYIYCTFRAGFVRIQTRSGEINTEYLACDLTIQRGDIIRADVTNLAGLYLREY